MPGFTHYDLIPTTPPQTIPEMIAELSGGQKGQLLNAFVIYGKSAYKKVSARLQIDEKVVETLFNQMDLMEETSRSLMRGEVVETPAVIDNDPQSPTFGEVLTPAVYNTPPATAGALLTAVQDAFSENFTSQQVEAVLTKMVEYSKHDGTGTWIFYAAEVVK